jgi:exosortase/archaeosortase family protein
MSSGDASRLRITQRLKATVLWFRLHSATVILLVLIFAAIGIVYGNDFGIIANEALQNEAFSHVLIFPFLAGFLFYLKKDVIKASLFMKSHRRSSNIDYFNEVLGVVFCLVALLLYWYGSFTFYPLEFHIASLPLFIIGIILIVLNPRALVLLIFPVLFIFFLVPVPTTAVYTAGGTLANVNTQISYNVLKSVGMPITLSSAYGTPTIQLSNALGQPIDFSVDVPCSGIYSLIAFTMFAAFLAFISRASVFKKILIFALGFFAFWVLNLARIIGIFSIAYWFGGDTALFIHSFAGIVLVFVGMLLILFTSEKLLKVKIRGKPPAQAPCPKCDKSTSRTRQFCENCGRYLNKSTKIPKTTFLKLIALILGCAFIVLSISAPTFVASQNNLELTSNANTQTVTSNVFPNINGYRLSFLYRDTAYEQIAQQDASLMYGYLPLNSSQSTIYADVGVSKSISNLHNWEVCYVSYQTAQGQYPLVNVLQEQDVQLLPDTSIIAKYFIFDSPQNYTQVTLYWFGQAPFRTGTSIEQKYYRISLIILAENSTNIQQYKEALFSTGQTIAASLEPMKTQALLSLGVPTIQYALIAAIVFLIFTKVTQNLAEQKKKNSNMKLFGNFASKKEKIVLQAINSLGENSRYTSTSEITENVEKQVGHAVNPKRVLAILRTLERYGFISRTLISKENIPCLLWKVRQES